MRKTRFSITMSIIVTCACFIISSWSAPHLLPFTTPFFLLRLYRQLNNQKTASIKDTLSLLHWALSLLS